jgi:hypothetical protein
MAMPADDSAEIIGAQRPRLCAFPDVTRYEQDQCKVHGDGRLHCAYAAGLDAVAFAADCGLILDDWQSWLLINSMTMRADLHWNAFEICWILPRQNGKNSCLEARQLFGLFVLREALQIHTAHEFKASSEHFLRMQANITGNDELMRKVKPAGKGIRTSHGEEAIELRPAPTLIFGPRGTQIRRSVAPRLRFLARSRGSGRSFTCDALYYDEAMILSDGKCLPRCRR